MSANLHSEASGAEGGIEIARGVRVPADAVAISFSRSSGPGGQNVNKLSTRAELRIGVDALAAVLSEGAFLRLRTLAGGRITRDGVLQIVGQEFRSQEQNRRVVFEKLRDLVEKAMIAPKARRATKPSKAAKRRRLDSKKRRGAIKEFRRGANDE